MTLLNLVARVGAAFEAGRTESTRTIQKVKDHELRDVVTALDEQLHAVSAAFVAERLPGARLLSEEGSAEVPATELRYGTWLVVDPLDGSTNHALGLPHFGYMAARLEEGLLTGAAIVLPEHRQYLIHDAGHTTVSRPLVLSPNRKHGTVYYAYPPRLGVEAQRARHDLLSLIDARSAGLYRYGSACAGLYHLLCGHHAGFIGHGIRLWDALAYLPVLADHSIEVRYRIDGLSITLLASRHSEFLDEATAILTHHQGLALQAYGLSDPLTIHDA